MSLSNKKCLVYDLGLFPELALRLLRDCAEVKYYVPWADAFPEVIKANIGENLDGLEKIETFWDHVDEADLIFIPDTMCSDVVEFLKKHNYPVCGAGAAEELEKDRWLGRQRQLKNGLPTQETHRIIGVTELSKFLKENKNYYIKIDKFRGLLESFKHHDWKSSEQEVDNIAFKAGPFKEDIVFIVEEIMKGIEPGIDGITFDGELLFPTMGGYEGKGVGIIERTYQDEKELPEALRIVNDGIAPEFKKYKTRFFFSLEMIIGKDKVPFLIDGTYRAAAPGTSAIQTEAISNFSEVIYGLATGQKVNPIIKEKYWAAISGESSHAEKRFLNIEIPKEVRQWTKLRMGCKYGKEYYAVPGFPSVVTVIGSGDTIDSAIEQVEERTKMIKASGLYFDLWGLKKLKDDIEEGKDRGVNF